MHLRSCTFGRRVSTDRASMSHGVREIDGAHWIFSSSSASSSSVDRSSSSSFSFCIGQTSARPRGWRNMAARTAPRLRSSSSASSRWCRRLNLLILSWSSRRTLTSSLASSSSLDSCEPKDLGLVQWLRGPEGQTHHAALHDGRHAGCVGGKLLEKVAAPRTRRACEGIAAPCSAPLQSP